MATLIRIKKTPAKIGLKPKKHSLSKAFGAAKEKNFSIAVKSRKELWGT